jgi:hypothetical protein
MPKQRNAPVGFLAIALSPLSDLRGLSPGASERQPDRPYLFQDRNKSERGWGLLGQVAKRDGNPNIVGWMTYVGIEGSGLISGRSLFLALEFQRSGGIPAPFPPISGLENPRDWTQAKP